MKIFGLMICFWILAVSFVSATVVTTEVEKPYDPFLLTGDLIEEVNYVGDLEGFPVMYEVTVEATTSLTAKLAQNAETEFNPFSLLVVRQNDDGSGVTEVLRFAPTKAEWQKRKNSVWGVSLLETEWLEKRLVPGVYKIEISTPNNNGPYLLTLGDELVDSLGYFATLGETRRVQRNFGYSVASMLRSSYVFYPLGIIFLLYLIYRTDKWRRQIFHVV